MKKIYIIILIFTAITLVCVITACSKHEDSGLENAKYDLSIPIQDKDGWYLVFEDDFEGDALNQNIKFGEKYTGSKEIWTTSPHAIRWKSDDESKPHQQSWWCPEMVEVKDSNAIIHS
ncbi:MAG: hypothetical protein ACI4VI_06090, partial [Acutalibacteraceae bacterium]